MSPPKTKNKHSASGQALGYLFQFERALHWMSILDSEAIVSIETDDDVTISLCNGTDLKKIYEQDKSSLSGRNPFANSSVDLWKSLAIWAEGIINGKFKLGKCRFILVTNKIIPKSSLICQLTSQKSTTNFDEKKKKFLSILKNPSTPIVDYCKIVSKLNSSQLDDLLKSIDVIDLNYLHDREEFKINIVRNLKMSTQITPNKVYSELLGWLMDYVIHCWVNKKDASIKVGDLITKSNELIARNFHKPFIELAEESLQVTNVQRKENLGENFVKQLNWVSIDEEDVLNAIDDFLRAKWERIRYASEGNFPSNSHFELFDTELKIRWKNQFEIHSIDANTIEQKLNNGKKVYWNLINTKLKLAGYETEQTYTTNGGYHRLANKFEIGWHINWKKLKSK